MAFASRRNFLKAGLAGTAAAAAAAVPAAAHAAKAPKAKELTYPKSSAIDLNSRFTYT